MRLLPVKKVADLADDGDASQAWLVEGIWGEAAVGILGGEPITSERLRLDDDSDLEALDATVAALKPRLLILDPFVRLHRIDENSSADVARVLDGLRLMQRRHKVAILVVHHAKKNGGSARGGQALRGSSEFHAWGDSMLYMRRRGDELTLTVEQRAAASLPAIPLSLTVVIEDQVERQRRTIARTSEVSSQYLLVRRTTAPWKQQPPAPVHSSTDVMSQRKPSSTYSPGRFVVFPEIPSSL